MACILPRIANSPPTHRCLPRTCHLVTCYPIVLCSGEHYDCGSCERSVHGGSDEMYLQEVRLATRELGGVVEMEQACFDLPI